MSPSSSAPNYFNPRSHEGSDRARKHSVPHYLKFQSTLPRGERPFSVMQNHLLFNISIHAPTRGATAAYAAATGGLQISIHAPTRGATRTDIASWQHHSYFNPRSHEGSDLLSTVSAFPCSYFNPRSHEGSDIL